MTKSNSMTWLALGLIVALIFIVLAAPRPAEASAAVALTSTQQPFKALCRKCQRPPAPD